VKHRVSVKAFENPSMSQEKIARDKLIARVRALLSMTTTNGCSEAEALNAAAMASKLMEEHDFAVSDIEAFKAEPVKTSTEAYGKTSKSRDVHPAATFTANAIARFFDCRVWKTGNTVSFFGMRDDVALAHDLLKLVRSAMDREVAAFKASGMTKEGPGVTAQTNSFAAGMGRRIGERLLTLKQVRNERVRSKGTDLVVIKSAIVTEAFTREFGENHNRTKQMREPSSSAAYAAGYHAGDRVGLGQQELAKPGFDSRTPGQQFQEDYDRAAAAVRAEIEKRQAEIAEAVAKANEAPRKYEETLKNLGQSETQASHSNHLHSLATRLTLCKEVRELVNFALVQAQLGLALVGVIWAVAVLWGYLPPVSLGPEADLTPLYLAVAVYALVWSCFATALKVRSAPSFDAPGERLGMAERIGFSIGTIQIAIRDFRDWPRRRHAFLNTRPAGSPSWGTKAKALATFAATQVWYGWWIVFMCRAIAGLVGFLPPIPDFGPLRWQFHLESLIIALIWTCIATAVKISGTFDAGRRSHA
jgi:Protein of unknown function (DUF2786)